MVDGQLAGQVDPPCLRSESGPDPACWEKVAETVPDFAKHQKPIGNTVFLSSRKRRAKTLIKPVVYWYFWSQNAKIASRNSEKPNGF